MSSRLPEHAGQIPTRYIELDGTTKGDMKPSCVLRRITDALRRQQKSLRGSRVCLLGVVCQQADDNCRAMFAFQLHKLLRQRGVQVSFNDPYLRYWSTGLSWLESRELTPEFLATQDIVVMVTGQACYAIDEIAEHSSVIIDIAKLSDVSFESKLPSSRSTDILADNDTKVMEIDVRIPRHSDERWNSILGASRSGPSPPSQ